MLLYLTTRLSRVALALVVFLAWAPAAHAWSWPVQGPVLEPFSFDAAHPYASGQHRGIDIGADAAGQTVVAPAAGTVTFAGTVPTSGKSVSIETADGYSVTLTHLGSLAVVKGATVAERDAVGTIGPSGTPELSGPYMHLGIRVVGDPNGYVDPLGLLPPAPDEAAKASDPSASQVGASGTSSSASGSAPSARTPPSQAPASTPATTRASSNAHVSSRASGRDHGRAAERPSELRPIRSSHRSLVRVGDVFGSPTPREAQAPVSRPRASEFTRRSRRPVVETAAPAEPTGLDTGHELGSSAPVERLVESRRPAPVALLPLTLNGGAALVALAAALAAARRRHRRHLGTSPVAAGNVVDLPRRAIEHGPVSRAA
jgi:Peptidase family M23